MADQSSPISVNAPGVFTQVSAGLNSGYGLREDGRVFAWGDNSQGQLGDNSITQRNTPVIVTGRHQFDYIAAGWNHVLGINRNGSTWSWEHSFVGDSGIDFTITNGGQVQYYSSSVGGTYSGTLKFKAKTFDV